MTPEARTGLLACGLVLAVALVIAGGIAAIALTANQPKNPKPVAQQPRPQQAPRPQAAQPDGPVMNGPAVLLTFLCLGVPALCVYIFPTSVAVLRRHPNLLAIAVMNLLLGWVFIGWVVALIWACSNPQGGGGNAVAVSQVVNVNVYQSDPS